VSHAFHVVAAADAAVDDDAIVGAIVSAGSWDPAAPDGPLTYRNGATGVQATLEAFDPDAAPAGFRSLRMALVVPYVRPRWFALETVPMLVSAVAAGGGAVFDPSSGLLVGEPADSGRLVESWDRGNRAAISAVRRAGGPMLWMDPLGSEEWWRHQRAIPGLTLRFALDHYVPSLRIVRNGDDERVLRAMSWPDCVPALLPGCDRYVLLGSTDPGQFTIRGVADAAAVRERLAGLVETVSLGWPEVDAIDRLPPDRSDEAAARLASLPLEPLSGYTGVDQEAFVDTPPDDVGGLR
jgi:hypothetical protein